jgi:hypothetical protein
MTASPPAESGTPESSTPMSETSRRGVPLRVMSAQQELPDERDFSRQNAATGGQWDPRVTHQLKLNAPECEGWPL